MILELWSNNEEEYGYIVDEDCVKRRVFLENHTLIEGLDDSDLNTLIMLHFKEIIDRKELFDINKFLVNTSRDWFTITHCVNKYVEFSDCIVFNHITNKFESIWDDYSKSTERYIELYDDEGNPIILGEYEFMFRRKLDIKEKYALQVECNKEDYLYKTKDFDNFLYLKSNPELNCTKGIVLSKSAAECLMNTTFVTQTTITCSGGILTIKERQYEQKKKTNSLY